MLMGALTDAADLVVVVAHDRPSARLMAERVWEVAGGELTQSNMVKFSDKIVRFTTLAEVTSTAWRGVGPASYHVDHHVWESGPLGKLRELRRIIART